jgi:hypothetical protein
VHACSPSTQEAEAEEKSLRPASERGREKEEQQCDTTCSQQDGYDLEQSRWGNQKLNHCYKRSLGRIVAAVLPEQKFLESNHSYYMTQ